jgi:hypothetical protein
MTESSRRAVDESHFTDTKGRPVSHCKDACLIVRALLTVPEWIRKGALSLPQRCQPYFITR